MNYSITRNSISVIDNGETSTVHSTAANFATLRDALVAEDWDTARANLTPAKSVEDWSGNKFIVQDGVLWYRGKTLPTELNARILRMVAEQVDPRPLFRFWALLRKNPSNNSITQLYAFLQHKNIPITEDGYILAYKSVRENMKDHYSGTLDNTPGQLQNMDRNEVSDNPAHACHQGLHVGSLEYASTFGGAGSPVVVVKVNPEHVVSVPNDCEQQKMRVCEYEVVKMYDGPLPSTVYYGNDGVEDDSEYDDYCDDCGCDDCECDY